LVPLPPRSQELWALLHFIMPQLFDSREAFTEWFTRVRGNGERSSKHSMARRSIAQHNTAHHGIAWHSRETFT
jgi:SNF2 family DNA or RNA helicase